MGIYDFMNMTGPTADRLLIIFGVASLIIALVLKLIVTNLFNRYISYLLALVLTIGIPFLFVTFILFPIENIVNGFHSSEAQGFKNLMATILFYAVLGSGALLLAHLNRKSKRK